MSMEYVEFVPGALAAVWMVYRMAILVIHGPALENAENSI